MNTLIHICNLDIIRYDMREIECYFSVGCWDVDYYFPLLEEDKVVIESLFDRSVVTPIHFIIV